LTFKSSYSILRSQGNMKPHQKKSLTPVLMVATTLLLIAIAMFLNREGAVFRGRASRSKDFSPANSYVFGSPLSANANGKEKIKISVFVLDTQGMGISQKKVNLQSTPPLKIESSQSTTNENGEAVFYTSSLTAGRFKISAQVEGQTLPQTVTVNFR